MFRTVRDYDGSDSEKCISLTKGDMLSTVHAVDIDWYIGRNERSGETGAFPASCVTKETEEKAAVSDQIARQNAEIFTVSHDSPPHDPEMHRAMSHQESVLSWHDSSFESTFQESAKHGNHIDRINKVGFALQDGSGSSFQKGKRDKLGVLMASTDMLFHSGREENKRMKAVFGIFAGLVIGCLLYVLLLYSFGYSDLVAGIAAIVCTIFICIGLAVFPACRCVIALVFPNFFTGKGRAILLSVIFAVLLSGPILNITHNAKETGNSMACVIDIIANQTRAMHDQLSDPVKDMVRYIDQQKEVLRKIKQNMAVDFDSIGEALSALGNDFDTLNQNLDSLYQECVKPISAANRKCTDFCDQLIFDNLKGPCFTQCSKMNSLTDICSQLKIGSSFQHLSDQLKSTLDMAESYFVVDISTEGDFSANANSSKEIKTIQDEVNEDIGSKLNGFQTFMTILNYTLSLTLLLMFVQAYLYFRNYMAKDGYDNIYITKEFIELDNKKGKEGEEALLPLKKTEQSEYIYTTTPKLKGQEFADCKVGLAQVFLHFLICIVVIIFDYFLYYILNLVHRFGNIEIDLSSTVRLTVDVKGNLASFYRSLFEGIDFNENFLAELHIGKCLPNPTPPTGEYAVSLVLLYSLALCFVLLRCYGMRLRRKIAAYYYPEQESARMEYLHKTIRHRRLARQRFLRQEIKSTHKESVMKEKFRVSSWIINHCPCFRKCISSGDNMECSSCEERQRKFSSVKLSPCPGMKNGKACSAVYCEDCQVILKGVCPLCEQDEEVELRD